MFDFDEEPYDFLDDWGMICEHIWQGRDGDQQKYKRNESVGIAKPPLVWARCGSACHP